MDTASVNTASRRLPVELFQHILSEVNALPPDNSWRSTLEACALVSTNFKHIIYPYLFGSVTFVLVQHLPVDDKAGIESFLNTEKLKKRSFYRCVTSISEIVSYLSQSRAVPSCIRRLTLRVDHPQLNNSGIKLISYGTFAQILQPLKHLQHISLMGVVIDTDPSDLRPILPSLQELVIDFKEAIGYAAAGGWITTSRIYSLCALFGEIRHLALRFIPMAGDNLADGIACPPVQAVTVIDCIPPEVPFGVLRYIPTHGLRALHFSGIRTYNTHYLTRLLAHIGPALKSLTLGEVYLAASTAHWADEEFPSNLTPIFFNSSVNLCDVTITIAIPYEKEQYMAPGDDSGTPPLLGIHRLKATQRVALQTLPPSVKTLKIALLFMHDHPPVPQTPAWDFWEAFRPLLDRLVDEGLERIELTTVDHTSNEASCTADEQELLRSYFPRLSDKDVLVFPEVISDDTFVSIFG